MADPLLFEQLKKLTTEKRNPRSMEIDTVSVQEGLRIIHEVDCVAATWTPNEQPTVVRAQF